jgi:hypothetical protein
VQLAAVAEGVFIPKRDNFSPFRLFSTEEAQQCLAGKRICLWGDSYMRSECFVCSWPG